MARWSQSALQVVCMLLLVSCARAAFVESIYTTMLSGQQVIPGPAPDQRAAAICVYGRNEQPVSLDCEVQHNVSDVTSIQIMLGPRGSTGLPLFSFDDVSQGRNVREVFYFEDTEDYSAIDLQTIYLSGGMFVQIYSESYPMGHLRGQLEHAHRAYARMNAANTIPLATGTTSEGIFLATYSINSPDRYMEIDVVHDVIDPIALDMQKGEADDIGPLVYSFPTFTSPSFDTVDLTYTENDQFLQDLYYVNLPSSSNPTGDIRGQLDTIDYIYSVSFTTRLEGNGTEATGCGLFVYHCDQRILEYVIHHSIQEGDVTGFIGFKDGQFIPLFSLPRGESPVYGSEILTEEEALALYNGNLIVALQSNFQGGIVGQINSDWDFWAYLSGTNEVSPVTTPATGAGIFRLVQDADDDDGVPSTLQYDIYHTVANPRSASFMGGAEGNPGILKFSIQNLNVMVDGNPEKSPWSGSIDMDDDELEALVDELLFFEITTIQHPQGEIRGTLKRIDPCQESDLSFSHYSSSPIDVFSYFTQFYSTVDYVHIVLEDSSTRIHISTGLWLVLLTSILLML